MVASYTGATNAGAGCAGQASAERHNDKPAHANCGPMTQQGAMGAHGSEMHPQGFLRLIGCHDSGRQKQETPPRLHA